jgi:hypothetical protein
MIQGQPRPDRSVKARSLLATARTVLGALAFATPECPAATQARSPIGERDEGAMIEADHTCASRVTPQLATRRFALGEGTPIAERQLVDFRSVCGFAPVVANRRARVAASRSSHERHGQQNRAQPLTPLVPWHCLPRKIPRSSCIRAARTQSYLDVDASLPSDALPPLGRTQRLSERHDLPADATTGVASRVGTWPERHSWGRSKAHRAAA